MTLQDELKKVKSGFKKNSDSEAQEVMGRATEDLRNSGILDRVLKTGDPIPDFVLETPEGEKISSSKLLSRGPLVIHFFRGGW
ncbi:MAG: hypothetical protein SCH72_10770 [Desulfuromonadales bacterium]|nr:hypothetical protein [Desulfuromonadales bacterium]